MRNIKRSILCGLLVMFPYFLFCQNEGSKMPYKDFNDSTLFVITNKVYDSLQNKFYNHIDQVNTLKYFKFEALDSTLNYQGINKKEFFDEILMCDKDLLIFIHGDGKTTNDAVIRAFKIQNLYAVKIIAFSWPSRMEKGNGLKNFKNSRKNIELGISKFKELLLQIQELKKKRDLEGKKNHISLFMHSLGNYYIERLVKDSLLIGLCDELFNNLIINAAAVNQKEHSKWMYHLHIQKRIYVTSNKQDFNLKGVRIFTKLRKQLGECLKLPLSEKANYINFTKAIGFALPTHVTHTYFLGKITNHSENINRFYFNMFHGYEIELNDTTSYIRRKDGLGYNILFD